MEAYKTTITTITINVIFVLKSFILKCTDAGGKSETKLEEDVLINFNCGSGGGWQIQTFIMGQVKIVGRG